MNGANVPFVQDIHSGDLCLISPILSDQSGTREGKRVSVRFGVKHSLYMLKGKYIKGAIAMKRAKVESNG